MRQTTLLFLSVLFLTACKGNRTIVHSNENEAGVDTVIIHSDAMKKDLKCVVILPNTTKQEKLPVVYLLHGHGGWYGNWIKSVPELKKYAVTYNLAIVCPDGGYNSWYFDSPVDSTVRFETYISQEVPAYIEQHYPVRSDRAGKAITGLSMGGHGGLFLGFRHADLFGACGSMSGGVDLRPFPRNWEIAKKIGDTVNYSANWTNYSVASVVEKPTSHPLKIIIDCGTEDFFYTVNRALHDKLLSLHIPHDYIERPGKHDWTYWKNAVQYQLLFFSKTFNSSPI